MKVLLSCPPMRNQINEFRAKFEEKGLELVIPQFVQTLTEEELIDIVPNVDAWIIGDDPATERVFEAGKKGSLKAVVKWGVGIDNVDFAACEKLGIPAANTPAMFGGEVADIAIAYLLGLARQTYYIDRELRKGNWVKPAGISISGKKIGVLGLGDIGRSVTKRLTGFDVHVIGYDPFTKLSSSESFVEELLPFPEKIEQIDFLIVTCALTPSSFHIVNENSLNKMKDGVFIINVSRGKLIDESALVGALTSGKVKAAALDVFETEPLPIDSTLRQLEQCIFGTHNGSNTVEAVRRASEKTMQLLFDFLKV